MIKSSNITVACSSISQFKNPEDMHNHKPMFKNCADYAPTIKEEEPAGTFVIQVNAEDEDPRDKGGKETSFLSYCHTYIL